MNSKLLKFIVVSALVIGFTLLGIFLNAGSTSEIETRKEYTGVKIYIEGEVNKPDIYLMDYEDRVSDVIYVAGGLTSDGTTEGLNLASKLTDGMRIIIPSKENNGNKIKISINSCNADDLVEIGLTKTKGQAVISYREEKGGYKNIEEIKNVTGITDAIYNKIKEYLIL